MSIHLVLRINLNKYHIPISSFIAEGFNKYRDHSINRGKALKRKEQLKSLKNSLELAWKTENLVFILSTGHKSLLTTH